MQRRLAVAPCSSRSAAMTVLGVRSLGDLGPIRLARAETRIDRVELDQRVEHGIGAHQPADIELGLTHASGEGRTDRGVAEIEFRRAQQCARSSSTCAWLCAKRAAGLVEAGFEWRSRCWPASRCAADPAAHR